MYALLHMNNGSSIKVTEDALWDDDPILNALDDLVAFALELSNQKPSTLNLIQVGFNSYVLMRSNISYIEIIQ